MRDMLLKKFLDKLFQLWYNPSFRRRCDKKIAAIGFLPNLRDIKM